MIRVLIADQHGVVREGLKDMLSATDGFTVVAEAQTHTELMEKLREGRIDVAVFDLSIAESRALDALEKLKRDFPTIPLLVFTALPEHEYGVRALKTGAAGYLTKDCGADEILAAIKRVAAGGKYVTPSLVELIADGVAETEHAPHERLSEREYTIFKLVAAGWRSTEIAEKLGLSQKTVATYKTRILIKLNVQTTAELIHYAMKHDLLRE
jgi:DNA-binding NarL/FixJ family response regulator